MIKGIGNDIIEISRIKASIEKHGKRFLDRLFTTKEQEYCFKHKESARHFAGRFAAKEAIAKAFGTGFGLNMTWLDIEILNDEHGKPHVHLSEKLASLYDFPELKISISHCHEYATAFAILS